jgi:SAM-dependent methyltransferase
MSFRRHPAAFALGLEGLALLRVHAGDVDDPAFARQRLAEIRRLLVIHEREAGLEQDVAAIDTVAGYEIWSGYYDTQDNPLIDVEAPAVRDILDRIPAGRAIDVACGTGRHTTWLAERGHAVVGVDSSPAMLARARANATRGTRVGFARAELTRLPIADAAADLVVCALALTHHPDLPAALAEFARVVRPGGHIVLSDIHVVSLYLGGVAGVDTADGHAMMPAHRRWASDYLTAALGAGLEVVSCAEPRWLPRPAGDAGPRVYPDATAAAYWDTPALIVWHLRRPRSS